MRHYTSILVIVAVIFSSSCKSPGERGVSGKKQKTLEMLKAEQDSVLRADSLKRNERRLQAIEEARRDSIKLAEQELQTNVTGSKYNIVVGSFFTPDNARKKAEEYRAQGYKAKVIVTEGNNNELVVIESYDQLSKAEERLRFIQSNVKKDAWIYVLK